VRLSRLLELYQTIEQGSSETPLVAFVKRLLNLDALDNLTQALHDIADVRRVRKVYPRFAELEDLQARLPDKQRRLGEEVKAAEEKQQARIVEASSLLNVIARPLNADLWNLTGVQGHSALLASNLKSGAAEVRLRALESGSNDLRRLRAIVSSDQTSDEGVRTLQQSIDDDTGRLAELSAILTSALRSMLERLALLHPATAIPSSDAMLSELWTAATIAIESLLSTTSTAVASLEAVVIQRKEADERRALLQTQLEDASAALARVTATMPRGVDVLTEIASLIDSDVW
jgi:hypothetical protein